MTLTVSFHPEAVAEFRANVAWYDEKRDGWGSRFEAAVDDVIEILLVWPESGAVWACDSEQTVRSYGISRFPYRLVYFVDHSEIIVIALVHNKRKPGYWRSRLTPVDQS